MERFALLCFSDSEVAVAVVVDAKADFSQIMEQFKSPVGKDGGMVEKSGRFAGCNFESYRGVANHADAAKLPFFDLFTKVVFTFFCDMEE